MTIIDIHKAKTHFSELVSQVLVGEEVIITESGNPIAKLVPYQHSDEPRKPGSWVGQIHMADDFDDELPEEIMGAFRGEVD